MKKPVIAILLVFATAGSAQAFTDEIGRFEGLEFVADTQIPGPAESNMSLCYVTQEIRIFGYTIVSNIRGYALADDGCVSEPDRPFSADQMATAQSLNLLDPNIPAVAKNSLERNLQNYGLWAAVGLALSAVVLRRIKSLLGMDLRGPLRNKASARIVSAMCHAAKCDGLVGSNELALISKTARRLTGRLYAPTDIIRVADPIDMNLTPHDYIAFGKGLRDREKDILMQGVFFILIADGRILPSEYEFVTELAHGLGMPGEDFRRVLNIALADLDKYPPTPSTSAAPA